MSNNSNLEFRKIKSLNFLYEINENGTVLRNVKSKRQVKIKLDMHHSTYGYYVAFCRVNGKYKRVMIHAAVAECWLGDRPMGMEVDHIDRNAHNNDYRNLRYVTKSERMKNRDHSNISETGSKNLEIARMQRAKPVRIVSDVDDITFKSFADCSRYLAEKYNKSFEQMRSRLKSHRCHIYDYDIIYLNAETKHDSFTEQEIVHKSDLTGDYRSAFNLGKQNEVENRVKHTGIEVV